MKVKTATLSHFKDLSGEDGAPAGTFEAIVSVFGNVDYAGDRVVKGAFAGSLARWKDSGDRIPVIWSHQWANPEMHIGEVVDAEERDEGLWVKGQLDVDDSVMAAHVHRLLSKRRVREFSFAYDVLDEKPTKDANDLLELDVFEVGPTLKGMNPDTQLLEAKARQSARAARAAKADDDGDGEDTHVPPQKVQDNAQAALDAIENGDAGEGFTETGQTRAEQLASGDAVPLTDVRDISAWHARHADDEGRDEEGTPAWVAKMAWGGDEARTWADGIVEAADDDSDSEDDEKSSTGTSSGRPGRKARVSLDGSYEQLQGRLSSVVLDWALAAFRDIWFAGLEATYSDHVVAYVETWDQRWGGGDYHQASYEIGDDGAISLGEPEEVELIGVVAPKSLPAAPTKKDAGRPDPTQRDAPAKAGPTAAESLLVQLDVAELDVH